MRLRNLLTLLVFLACVGKTQAQSEIHDFAKLYRTQVLKVPLFVEQQVDVANGYMFVCTPPEGEIECGLGSTAITMAMWKTAKGESIFGVFPHACGGMGCWAESWGNLRFYNAQAKDITARVIDITQIQLISDKVDLIWKNDAETVVIKPEERSVFAEIPRRGTTIKLTVGKVGIMSKEFADLVFDKVKGTFKFVAK